MIVVESNTVNGFIPDQVRSFYDPNNFFASSEHSEDALLSWVDSKREEPLVLPHIGSVATRQLVAVELAHVGLIDLDNASTHSEWLGIPVGYVEQGIEAAQAYANDVAQFSLNAVAQLRHNRPSSALAATSDMTLAGAILSANAHRGQTRVVKKRPYYSHPRDVALLLNSSYRSHLSEDSDPSLPLYDFKSLLHDGFEDSFPKDGMSFLASPNVTVSPLVLGEVLQRLGVEQTSARQHALGMLALTKTVGIDGRMSYQTYIERFEQHANEIPIKLGDLQHNYRLDAKSLDLYDNEENRKLYLKKEEYNDAQRQLIIYYSNSDQVTGPDWLNKQLFAQKIITLNKTDLENATDRAAWARIPEHQLIDSFKNFPYSL